MSAADWVNLTLRWVHFIVGIGWIGTSFYFIWLDNHLVADELWMVHSGGFYRVERRRIGPGQMPGVLHWFKWEALLTWITGFLLLTLIYYLTGGVYLVDPAVSSVTTGTAVALGVGVLIVSWLVYDALYRSPLGANGPVAAAISFALLALAAIALCGTLSGRAAFIHVGALLGTLMVANVWLRILPAQQQMIDATAMGRAPDFSLGERAKRRSVHNSYMTFPVLFIMLSNHFPAIYGHRLNWLILLLLVVVGAGARHVMIAKGGGIGALGARARRGRGGCAVPRDGAAHRRHRRRARALCRCPRGHQPAVPAVPLGVPLGPGVHQRCGRRGLRYAGEHPTLRGAHQGAGGGIADHAARQQDRDHAGRTRSLGEVDR